MAVTTYYTLTLGGTIREPYVDESRIKAQWEALIGEAPTHESRLQAAADAKVLPDNLPWPYGFLRANASAGTKKLKGSSDQEYDLGGCWKIEAWEITVEPAGSGAFTKVSFEGKAEFKGHGGIDDHKESQKLDAAWFFDHKDKSWHQTLKDKLTAFNEKRDMVDRVWFREFEFYCGNGGGGGE